MMKDFDRMPSMNFTMSSNDDCFATGFNSVKISPFFLVYSTFPNVVKVTHTSEVEDVTIAVEIVSQISLIFSQYEYLFGVQAQAMYAVASFSQLDVKVSKKDL